MHAFGENKSDCVPEFLLTNLKKYKSNIECWPFT